MARKTKQEAQATRCSILDAAEALFYRQGVARTSLQDIAGAAGVTRGAIYWHFADKSDLFNAMMDRVVLPMEEASASLATDDGAPALPALRALLLDVFDRVTREAALCRVVEIAFHKVEYVGELDAVRARRVQIRHSYRSRLERALRRAQTRGEVRRGLSAPQLAIGLHALLDGLLQNWLLDPAAFDLRRTGAKVIDVHLAGMSAAQPGATLAGRRGRG